MLRVVKVRLYPDKKQINYINDLLGSYRKVYNLCLDKKKTAYITNKTSLNLKELGHYFHNELTKSEQYSYLNKHNTKVLKQSIMNLLEAYKNFFINGNGFPRFKSKHDNTKSCRFPVDAISTKNKYETKVLSLGGLKNLKFECSDKYKIYLDKHKLHIKSAH